MPLYNIIREYEERRQALINQLQNKKDMDPAMQHQIYGAIKEIENVLKSLEIEMASSQDVGIELSRDRPRPLVERTKKIAGKMRSGTRKVVKEHIPRVTKKVTAGPKRYFAKRKEKKLLKKEIERQLLARMQHDVAASGKFPSEFREEVEKPVLPELTSGDLHPESSGPVEMDRPRDEAEPVKKKAVKKAPKKAKKKTAKKKAPKKKAVKKGPKKKAKKR